MRSQLLEAKVLSIVDEVQRSAPVEDSRVELKTEWPTDHRRAARQIAAMANAAGSEPVLWIIGVDERSASIPGADPVELADWLPQIERCFDEITPESQSLSVSTPGGPRVIALLFDTSRAPYVIKTDNAGGVSREIPWRSGNSTRSAKRSEIIRALVEEATGPTVTLVRGQLSLVPHAHHPDQYKGNFDEEKLLHDIQVRVDITFFADAASPIMLPAHLWSFTLYGAESSYSLQGLRVIGPQKAVPSSSGWARATEPTGHIHLVPDSGLHIARSDTFKIVGQTLLGIHGVGRDVLFESDEWIFSYRLPLASSTRAVEGRLKFRRIHDTDSEGTAYETDPSN